MYVDKLRVKAVLNHLKCEHSNNYLLKITKNEEKILFDLGRNFKSQRLRPYLYII